MTHSERVARTLIDAFSGHDTVMVEIHAARSGRTLHNHAAHLLFVEDGRVSEWWMVEALPAESDAFWST
jgi:ketosteroid isomerase-like protein